MSEMRDLATTAASVAGRGLLLKVALIALALLIGGLLLLAPLAGVQGRSAGEGASGCLPGMPSAGVGDTSADQEEIAATASQVASQMNMPGRAVLIILMTGFQESGLRNIDYGDRDSVGWLQQRPSQGWGTVEQIMDPAYAARKFYETLRNVDGWVEMELWQAADAVQRSAYPTYYARHEDRARALAATLGIDLERPGDPYGNGAPSGDEENGSPSTIPVAGGTGCEDFSGVTADGWTHPAPGMSRLTSRFGEERAGYTHMGDDLAAAADTPIYAAADGVVTHASCEPFQGRSECNILIDHGTDPDTGLPVQTLYVHMFPDGVNVQSQEEVTAGQQIGAVGNNGNSQGYHLHFEVWVAGVPTAPVQFMTDHGVDITQPGRSSTVPAGDT